ncbi:MAG: RDD family protein [Bacteroidia bacterium]
MDAVTINTTQNVVIDYQPAGLGNRILAGLLDMLFKWAYLITMIILLFTTKAFDSGSTTGTVILIIVLAIPYLFYDLLFEIFAQGQSLGKKIIKIKVVKLDGTQPSIGSFLLRWLIRFFEIDLIYGMIAIVSIAASKNRQRLGDMAAGTTVIVVRPALTLKDTILQAEQKSEYKITFPQVVNLTEKDIEIMKEVYDFYMKTGKTDGLNKLAEKVKTKAGIQTTMRDGELISTLMKDYNHYRFEE